jgi:hypothetical protein
MLGAAVIGFFGRAKQTKEQLFKAVTDIAFDCLCLQKVLISDDEYRIQDAEGKINGKALGYVFGFFDALLQSKALDIRDTEGLAAMLSLLARLFPIEVGKCGTFVAYLRSNMANDAVIQDGVMLGGKQAKDFLKAGTPPVRWVLCFSKEMERLAEQRDRQSSSQS